MKSEYVYIYALYKGQKKYKPMDLKTNQQVTNLVRATRIKREEGDRFMRTDALINEDWKFELRDA